MDAKTQTMSAVTADPTAGWHSEASSISAANPTFAARVLTAQTLVTRCQASLELTQDSPDFGMQLAAVMSGAMAAELDRVGLEGSGTPPEPKGILNTSSINTVTAVGAIADYSKIVTGLGKLLQANFPLEAVDKFAIMHPLTWARFENLATGISSDKTQLARPKAIENMQFLNTTNLAKTFTSPNSYNLYLGAFENLTLGVRRESSVEILKADSYAGNLVIDIIGYLRADYIVTRPGAFCVLENITP